MADMPNWLKNIVCSDSSEQFSASFAERELAHTLNTTARIVEKKPWKPPLPAPRLLILHC
eukprot:CAMPEP_0206542998 /NCGR_PEP_ID=MMETSP0325_2-20121206/10543_1 /ASSEMBLY_ACC=CAM_ASM_000347 /TAXON_ID=2866 /ORGANISM="Crypthecodinium cohnii, Strain Seligo" /LENGTH=59 /DNA_ID=CAMNT_0054041237 /DNA_START=50 /DNA_END=226 /DNA_ORIENTATION=+